jgi:IPT/TIG domain
VPSRPSARAARRLGAALALTGAIFLAAVAASASALVVTLPNGEAVSLHPLAAGAALAKRAAAPQIGAATTTNLRYHGGPVMPSNTNYAVYWAPSGAPAYPAGYRSGLNRFFEDLAHDSGGDQNVDSVATQYGDSAGELANYDSRFGGAIIDADPYPADGCAAAPICLTDAQIKKELSAYVKAHGLPQDLTHEYFMLTPPGVESCFERAGFECSAGSESPLYCAYHGFIKATGGPIVYANDPYVTGIEGCDSGEHPNDKPSDGAIDGGLSHEHNESITDPQLNAWYDAEGFENGDKCNSPNQKYEYGPPLGTAPDGSRYNQVINGDLYWYQQEWSNEGSRCKQRAGSGPTVTGVTPKRGPAAGGTTVTITGSGFALGTTATTIKFGAAASQSVNCTSSTQCTAVSPKHAVAIVDVRATVNGVVSAKTTADHFRYL